MFSSHVTPPSSFKESPLTPPPTDEKICAQAPRVIRLLQDIQAGKHVEEYPWREFQVSKREYAEIERLLRQDKTLFGYVEDKIRYDYYGALARLVIRMPTGIHEVFIDAVEDIIRSQLKGIRSGSDKAAAFAQKVRPARSTKVVFVDEASGGTTSKYEPDASFWHDDALYPGVVIEVAYSQKKKRLGRLAEDYLLDSDASVRVVVGLDIEYGRKGSSKATLSVWRTQMAHTPDGNELCVVQEVADEAFRDDHGSPTDSHGLQLHLSDFACQTLTGRDLPADDRVISVSTLQLCQCLAVAEEKIEGTKILVRDSLPGFKKRKRAETPPERIASDDEARYAEKEQRAAKRVETSDPDYNER